MRTGEEICDYTFVISRSQVQIPSVAPVKPAPRRKFGGFLYA
nr:MAG TPA: hypothetical protein [Caudoviricetes sp.]